MPSVAVDGLGIHYDQRGSGPEVVLLHGIGGNTKLWRYQLEGLSDAFRVTAWDAPGYGGSDDPEGGEWTMADYAGVLEGFLRTLGIERAHIVGQSWGGVLTQEFYRRCPERFVSLTLSDTYAGGGAQPPEERDAALQARLRALDTMTPAEMARQRVSALLMEDAPQALIDEVSSVLAEIHSPGYRMAAIALAGADTRDVHPTITVPTLITAGDHDRIVPPGRAREMHASIPGSRLVMIENAGHLPCVERSEIYNAAVRKFIEDVGAATEA
jgi:pimeloyl-ACP methyl ester carboxylesterase